MAVNKYGTIITPQQSRNILSVVFFTIVMQDSFIIYDDRQAKTT